MVNLPRTRTMTIVAQDPSVKDAGGKAILKAKVGSSRRKFGFGSVWLSGQCH